MSHDQNFKNLILDYPRQALAFFAAAQAHDLPKFVRITPLRQEQLQERLGERFRELDTPLLVEWPDGRREALLFVVEEETEACRFSIYRLVCYCADLAELCQTDRVVPVVVFLRGSPDRRALTLGSERHTYLSFTYLSCELADLPYSHEYPAEVATMTNFAERFREEGKQLGEATMLLRQLCRKFGDLPDAARARAWRRRTPTPT